MYKRQNYALAQRAPNPSELFSDGLHHSAARIELGDLRISNESSHKLSASFENSSENWGYTINPYFNFISDFILLEPTDAETTNRGPFPVWNYRQTDARFFGIDITGFTKFNSYWKTNHSFSFVKAKDITENGAIINIPPANFRNGVTYLRSKWNDFEIGLESTYVFRQNEVPPNIMVFTPEQQQEVELEINTAPAAYHLLALNTKMKFSVFKNSTLTTTVIAENLLNTNYRDYLNRQRFFADDLGRNITLQLKLNY